MTGRGSPPERRTGLLVFTRDLRIHDHPALAAAARHDAVVPTFVFDDGIGAGAVGANRLGFLLACLDDLDESLRQLGAPLVLRRGDWVGEVLAVAAAAGAGTIHLSDDYTPLARRRLQRLEQEASAIGIAVQRHPGVTAVPPGSLRPAAGDHYQMFTPYYDRWRRAPLREPAAVPPSLAPVVEIPTGTMPFLHELTGDRCAPMAPLGGEHEARRRVAAWSDEPLAAYAAARDDLAGDATSGMSPYLHFGCISPLELVLEMSDRPGGESFVRQLCWREFFHQVLAARPDAAWADYRHRGDRWLESPEHLEAWTAGLTGYPVVDAAMRQLRREGVMHNRARMIVASFLTKDLLLDWREGARHFLRLLADGDIANNNLNWQWVAGTGTDTNPHRIFNPTVQARRYDPDGEYVRRYVRELRPLAGPAVHDPSPDDRRRLGYPLPIVDHHEAIERYRRLRGARSREAV